MMQPARTTDDSKYYLIGGGIASLAAAAFLIRDGGVKGHQIQILEASQNFGGSLDAAGNGQRGYRMRGGRMLESKYVCTFDLFGSIPTLDGRQSVTEEIFAWNRIMPTSSKSRLFRGGHRVDAPVFGLTEQQVITLEALMLQPERMLGRSSIAEHFDATFFRSDFWFMWCSTFAFQPWHSAVELKRYLVRFLHMVSGFNTLSGIMRTVYNQNDSLVRPLRQWLEQRGVQLITGARATDLRLSHSSRGYAVEGLFADYDGVGKETRVRSEDSVLITLGSMTEQSSFGSMDAAPVLLTGKDDPAWSLWRKIASGQQDFGHPANFADHVEESKWVSFTTTFHNPAFFNRLSDLTGNAPGEGGLITFPESSWLASIVLPHQPHFPNQPEGVQVMWGYGLAVDRPGDFVQKPLSACTGREIMIEIMGHLRIVEDSRQILETCICIPCMMPFITSQFLRRSAGDRPDVVPARALNLAFIGEFCELPDDVVFTVEYSIRSAQTAVYSLLGLEREPPPVYKGHHNPRVLLDAFRALHESGTR